MNHPGQIKSGYSPILDIGTSHVSGVFELLSKIDRRTGKILEESPKFIETGDAAMIKITPRKPVSVEPFDFNPSLGRFSVRDMKQTIAVGVVKSVER